MLALWHAHELESGDKSKEKIKNIVFSVYSILATSLACVFFVSVFPFVSFGLMNQSFDYVDSTFRFASTAPWYIEDQDGSQRISQASAQFFLDWVDERIDRINRSVTDVNDLRAVLEPHLSARTFWQNRVQIANADLNGDVPP